MRAPGTIVGGRYRLVDKIGEGGMGSVYQAEDQTTGDAVAIKFIRKEGVDERSIERFRREARFAAAVHHQHVIEVFESGLTEDGTPYLVMELLSGQGLDERLHELPPPTVGEVVRWGVQALRGLAEVHRGGVLHRDLKPANLFLCRGDPEPTVKVLDFGLSRAIATSENAPSLTTLTATHQFLGTPYYVSPEQVRSARDLDERSDLYAVGVILYEALTGQRPFDGPNVSAVIAAVVADQPPPLCVIRPDLPRKLEGVVHKALERDPDARYPDADAMADALEKAGRGLDDLRATPRALSRPSSQRTDSGRTGTTRRSASSSRSGLLWPLVAVFVLALAAGGASVWLAQQRADRPPVDVAEPAGGPPTDDTPGPYRLAGPAPFGELAMRVLHADVPLADLQLVRSQAGFSVITPAEVPPSRARSLSARLGSTAVAEATEGDVLMPALLRTTVSLNLRAAPDVEGTLVRTLPNGTVVFAAHGRLDQATSELGDRGTWSYVAATGHDVGWSASSFLEPYSGCVPDPAALPEAPEPALMRDATFSRRRVQTESGVGEAFLVVARQRDADRSFLGLYQAGPSCDRLDSLGAVEVPGFIEDVLLAETAPSGGESLLLVSWHRGASMPADGIETWSAYRVGARRPVWELRLASSLGLPRHRRASLTVNVTRGPDGERAFWPLRVRHVDRTREYFEWDGRTLRPWTPPVAAP